MKPSCYNRPDFKDAVTVQDGWDCAGCRHNAEITGRTLAQNEAEDA